MERLLSNWKSLSPQKQAIAIAVTLIVALATIFLAQTASRPPMALLYSGLDPQSAGEVLAALESKGVKSEVRGDAIYVPKNRRDAVRLELATDGLPAQGQAGFEIFDAMNSFATTSEMFDAAYWRAEEGELARTILATPGVKAARVHLAVPKIAPFERSGAAPSGSVTVTMSRGMLTHEQAQSIRFIVALAVPRLDPDMVAVIDSAAGVILAPNEKSRPAEDLATINAREAAVEQRLTRLLEARVGAGNARVSVSIELDQDTETVIERIVDPQKRALTERAAVERTESGSAGGVVTVASNLPEGDAGGAAAPDRSSSNETNETTKFDVSETKRERVSAPGAVKRIQVAVLVNQLPAPAEDAGDERPAAAGKRSDVEIEALRKLVSAAVGFDATRGDIVTIESMEFDRPEEEGSLVVKSGIFDYFAANAIALLQLIIPALVALILALFVLKPILTSGAGGGRDQAKTQTAPGVSQIAAPASADAARAKSPIELLQRVAMEEKDASTSVLQAWFEESETAA